MDIFRSLSHEVKTRSITYEMKISYLEIYNENVNNILVYPPERNLKIRETKAEGVTVLNCDPYPVKNE